MTKMRPVTAKETSTAIHIGLGVITTIVLSLALSVGLAALVNSEMISISTLPLFAALIHAISTFIGSMVSMLMEKKGIAIVAGIICGCYAAILIGVNMLIFSNGFSGLLTGITGILLGSGSALLINMKLTGQSKFKLKTRSR